MRERGRGVNERSREKRGGGGVGRKERNRLSDRKRDRRRQSWIQRDR